MTNPAVLTQLKTPTVPEDFNGGVGVDFARALFTLLNGSQIVSGDLDESEPFDAAQLVQQMEALTTKVDGAVRKQRQILMQGVNNGELTVPFASMETVDYSIETMLLIPAGNNPPTITTAVVDGSRTASQFKIRIDGNGNPYKFLFIATEIKNAV